MKKKLLIVLVVILVCVLTASIFVACDKPEEPTPPNNNIEQPDENPDDGEEDKDHEEPEPPVVVTYKVSAWDNGVLIKEYKTTEEDNVAILSLLKTPSEVGYTKEGYEFEGWYYDKALTQKIESMFDVVDDNISVFAKFVETNKYANFSDSFSGFSEVNETAEVTDLDNSTNSKLNVLNRQFEILSTNILLGLTNVYGIKYTTENTPNYGSLKDFAFYNDFCGRNVNFKLSDFIMESYSHTNHNEKFPSVDCIACYTEFYNTILSALHGNRMNCGINNDKAINGGGTWNSTRNYVDANILKSNYVWKWGYTEGMYLSVNTDAEEYNTGYVNKYKDKLKLELAQIVAKSEETDYNKLIQSVNHAGFTATEKQNIKNFVLNEIIGSWLVNVDNNRKPEDGNLQYLGQWSSSEHDYKAYSMLVPAIVDQAFNKRLSDGTEAYPFYVFESVETTNSLENVIAENGKEIYLQPKNINKLKTLEIEADKNATLTISVCNNGSVSAAQNFNLVTGLNYLNLTNAINSMSEFNGSLNFENSNLFNGGIPVKSGTSELDISKIMGKNYIKIVFSGVEETPAKITFLGYYEKEYKDDQIIINT